MQNRGRRKDGDSCEEVGKVERQKRKREVKETDHRRKKNMEDRTRGEEG